MYTKSQSELDLLGVSMLPRTLEEALDAFEADPLSKAVFGAKMFDAWLEYKRAEWHAYSVHVTDWEKQRYLKLI
jgi:glutamine synthetase